MRGFFLLFAQKKNLILCADFVESEKVERINKVEYINFGLFKC